MWKVGCDKKGFGGTQCVCARHQLAPLTITSMLGGGITQLLFAKEEKATLGHKEAGGQQRGSLTGHWHAFSQHRRYMNKAYDDGCWDPLTEPQSLSV